MKLAELKAKIRKIEELRAQITNTDRALATLRETQEAMKIPVPVMEIWCSLSKVEAIHMIAKRLGEIQTEHRDLASELGLESE